MQVVQQFIWYWPTQLVIFSFIVWFLWTQIIYPAAKEQPLFPWFRKRGKLKRTILILKESLREVETDKQVSALAEEVEAESKKTEKKEN